MLFGRSRLLLLLVPLLLLVVAQVVVQAAAIKSFLVAVRVTMNGSVCSFLSQSSHSSPRK
jgi:positive regulator of sigma E activity